MIKERIADNLKRLRKDAGLTQKEVAQAVCVHERTYQSYEQKKAEPSIELLMRLVSHYRVTINDIIQ